MLKQNIDAVKNSPERLKSQTEIEMARYITERENDIRQLVNDTQKKISDLKSVRAKLLEEYLENAPDGKGIRPAN